jgi:hypothetical protein
MQENNTTERLIDRINTSFFFKEFTFGSNLSVYNKEMQKIELADNIVLLDNIALIFQIKERSVTEKSTPFEKWFNNKVLNKAVKQVKNTVRFIKSENQIEIQNNRGHKRQLKNICQIGLKKIVIYNPKEIISEKFRYIKFYESKEVGLIHLFHIEDYHWICKYLLTPAEVDDYLFFREELYKRQFEVVFSLPEQYVLGHYLSGYDVDHIDLTYVDNLAKLTNDIETFNLDYFLSKFGDKVVVSGQDDDYYFILKELAKLNRDELREFKIRFDKAIEMCKEEEVIDPYRITLPRTGCGFVFVPLPKEKSSFWKNALTNVTLAHKYDHKLDKCIGVVVFDEKNWTEVFWMFVEEKWQFDLEAEEMVKCLPLRDTKMKQFKGYSFK